MAANASARKIEVGQVWLLGGRREDGRGGGKLVMVSSAPVRGKVQVGRAVLRAQRGGGREGGSGYAMVETPVPVDVKRLWRGSLVADTEAGSGEDSAREGRLL